MTTQATINKLIEMRLSAMASALRIQLQDPSMASLSFEERLGLLVDTEYSNRKSNKLKRLIQNARFDQTQAYVADINYSAARRLDKPLIDQLGSCDYISERHNIIIMGASGAGKSYISCALGMEACKRFYTVRYIRLPELLAELAIARGEGEFQKVIAQYKKCNLLIIDEWMLVSLTETESRDLLEIVHVRHKKASTIFCSQFAPAGWHGKISQATLADAILDRIVHDSYIIQIHGGESERSMREVYGLNSSG